MLLKPKKTEFYLNLVYELHNINDKKPCPCTNTGEPEFKKIGFVAPFFATSEISKTINMLN